MKELTEENQKLLTRLKGYKTILDSVFEFQYYNKLSDTYINTQKPIQYRFNNWLYSLRDREEFIKTLSDEDKGTYISEWQDAEILQKYKETRYSKDQMNLFIFVLLWGIETLSSWKDIMSNVFIDKFWRENELDDSYEMITTKWEKILFRISIWQEFKGPFIVARRISKTSFTPQELWLPQSLIDNALNKKAGLIIITWPTGSGKTTTLVSLIDQINKTQRKKIITLEDPIEFLYDEASSDVTSRQIWKHVSSFWKWVIWALRQHPDIIVVWEWRDKETIQKAVEAASTWHLVFMTFHAASVKATIKGLIQRWGDEIKALLSDSILSCFVQNLVESDLVDGKFLSYEFSNRTIEIVNDIREEGLKLNSINEVLYWQHWSHLDFSLMQLMLDKKISMEKAMNSSYSTQKEFIANASQYVKKIGLNPNRVNIDYNLSSEYSLV